MPYEIPCVRKDAGHLMGLQRQCTHRHLKLDRIENNWTATFHYFPSDNQPKNVFYQESLTECFSALNGELFGCEIIDRRKVTQDTEAYYRQACVEKHLDCFVHRLWRSLNQFSTQQFT